MTRASRKRLFIGLLVLAVAGGLVGWRITARLASGRSQLAWATGTAEYGPISVSVSGSGALQPGRVEDVRLTVSGRVRRLLVANGDPVTAGQLLLELDNEGVYLAWEQARLTYEAEAERLDDMYRGTRASVSPTALRAAELRVEQARLTLQTREKALAELTVKARDAARVDSVEVKAGDDVTPGTLLMTLQQGPGARVRLAVGEDQIGAVSPGDPASVVLAPLPDVHIVRLSLGETSVYGLRRGDLVVATIDGQWVSSSSPIVRGTVVDIRPAQNFFEVICRLPGLPASVPAGATAGFMQIYPSGQQAAGTIITASGKLAIATDIWGLEAAHAAGEATTGRVLSVGTQGTAAGGVVTYPVTIEIDEYPAHARAGMSVHAAIQPAAGSAAVYGLSALEFPQTKVAAPAAGKVGAVLVSPGQPVAPGQALIQLDSETLRLQLELARNDLEAQENALRDLTRPQHTERELRTQEIRLRQAELALDAREADVRGLRVLAPQDGVVSGLNAAIELGRDLAAGFQVCRVLNQEAMLLTLQVDELEVDQLRPGMPADITVDAVPGQVFAAAVAEIAPEGQYSQGVSRFAVTLTIEPSLRLRSQMTTNATIFVAAKERALLVPAEGVTFFREGEAEVSRINSEGRAETTRITIGLHNSKHVEVLSGLNEGDRIVTGVITVPGMPNWRNPGAVRIPPR